MKQIANEGQALKELPINQMMNRGYSRTTLDTFAKTTKNSETVASAGFQVPTLNRKASSKLRRISHKHTNTHNI